MIVPNIRASFGPEDIEFLLSALADHTGRTRESLEGQLLEEGPDSLLDHPAAQKAVQEWVGLRGGGGGAPPRVAFYVMVRHTLLEAGLPDPRIADYIAALLVEFTRSGRAQRIARYDDKTYCYLVDLVADIESESSERRQFLLRAHLGNYSLWLSGLFPDFVVARVHRKGAPGLGYYEDLGATGFRLASQCRLAGHYDVADIYRNVADGFTAVRRVLNRMSDRFFFATPTPSVDRLLRQVTDDLLQG